MQEGKKDEDFGGLGLYLDLKRIGYVELPEEQGCSENCEASEGEVKAALSPPEIMIGCHKTSDDPTRRGFTSGVFDEVAYWGQWLNDTVKPYFLGGYRYDYGAMDPDQLTNLLDKVDMTKPDQFDQAVNIVDLIVSDVELTTEFGNKYETTATDEPLEQSNEILETTTAKSTTSTTTTTSPSEELVKEQAEKIDQLLNVALSLTDINALTPSLSRLDFETRFQAVVPVGEILSVKGKYHPQYDALFTNASIVKDSHTVRENAKEYLKELIHRLEYTGLRKDNPAYYGMRSSTSNFATELYRLESLQFQALGAQNEESYFAFPNWAIGHRWGKIKASFGIDTDPIDQIQSKSEGIVHYIYNTLVICSSEYFVQWKMCGKSRGDGGQYLR